MALKKHIKNLSLLCVVLAVCVAVVGTGFGHWPETLKIDGTATVQDCSIKIIQQWTNDSVNHPYDGGVVLGNDYSIADGFAGDKFFTGKDVGCTDCTLVVSPGGTDYDTCLFTVTNAYPGYLGEVEIKVKNTGSMDVELYQVDIIFLGDPTDPSDDVLHQMGCFPDFCRYDTEYELAWSNGGSSLPVGLNAGGIAGFTAWVHMMDLAAQDTAYYFQVKFHFRGPI